MTRTAPSHVGARLAASLLLLTALIGLSPVTAQIKKREHLTAQEVELVRDAQQLDTRLGVFIKATERRLQVLSGEAPAKVSQKEAEAWGEPPKGTRAELLYDIAHILDEAIENVDDASQRGKQSAVLPKALRKLSEASTRFLAQLQPLRESTHDRDEREQLEVAVENLQQIIAAAKKLPADEKGAKKN